MYTIKEILENEGIHINDFDDVKINEEILEYNFENDILKTWEAMLKSGASAKEQYNFAVNHGFLSSNHLTFYCTLLNEIETLKDQLKNMSSDSTSYLPLKGHIQSREKRAKNMRNRLNYINFMKREKRKDISPYGIDLLKKKPNPYKQL